MCTGIKYLHVQIQYTLFVRIYIKRYNLIKSNIARIFNTRVTTQAFETYIFIFFMLLKNLYIYIICSYKEVKDRVIFYLISIFLPTMRAKSTSIVESCITERLPQERFIILWNRSHRP